MITVYQTVEGKLVETDDMTAKGVWINIVEPSPAEINRVSSETGMSADMLRAALDEEERSRIEVEDEQLLILINIPVREGTSRGLFYDTVPLGFVVTPKALATVCLRDTSILGDFVRSKAGSVFTYKKTRFVLQVLLKTANYYLRYLMQIDKRSSEIENQLHRSMRNEELIKLFNLGKSLVYFRTSLRANEIVLEKLLRSQWTEPKPNQMIPGEEEESKAAMRLLKMYPEDEDLLEDVIIENKQALEMTETYSNVLSGMMDAFASVISNNLNIVMKFLTSVTIILALPTMVASFYGMNVGLPFQNSPYAFAGIILVSVFLSVAAMLFLINKKMF